MFFHVLIINALYKRYSTIIKETFGHDTCKAVLSLKLLYTLAKFVFFVLVYLFVCLHIYILYFGAFLARGFKIVVTLRL